MYSCLVNFGTLDDVMKEQTKPTQLFLEFWNILKLILREKFPYSKNFWSVFFGIKTEYGEIRGISPHSVKTPENTY